MAEQPEGGAARRAPPGAAGGFIPPDQSRRRPAYAELHACSNYSFLRGASHPEELVRRAHRLGYAALALTDECSVAGAVRAHLAARDAGLRLIHGSWFSWSGGEGARLVLFAPDREAWGDLCALITRGRRAAPKGSYHITRDDIAAHSAHCLALLVPGEGMHNRHRDGGHDQARWLADVFPGRAWIAMESRLDGRDEARRSALEQLAARVSLPLVATGGVEMHARARRRLHDVLCALRLGTTVAGAGFALHASGERHLRSRRALAALFPRPLLDETLAIAARCAFSLDELRYEYPEELVPEGETPASHLARLVAEGARQRWPGGTPRKVDELIAHELALIAELRYEPYFLTVHDIVRFARSRGILCQGRGSAANSVVCYCLGITEVNPDRIETLFERFISRERGEPPDIDVDFENGRREEVMQYLYQKYGRDRAALTATVITYRRRSALRDATRALVGAPELMILGIARQLVGFPRHLSQHVGGFVITRGALSRLVPIENAAMPDRTVIQWDKDDLDALGLLKVDVLALGMLSAIRRALDLVSQRLGRPFTLSHIPPGDPAVYTMIQQADTVGVFQIESRAQMSMLPRLRPACFYDLVIEVAIVRPGPIQGKMVHPYLRRRQGMEPVVYPSEAVRDVLERTLGVPLFQEQVIKLVMVAGGFTPGEADQLRRAMATFRRRGGMERFESRLLEGMRVRGYGEEFARQIWQQILGFGEYGFPESHSASFALLVYASAWLKRHEPAAFLCALLNSQPMGFYAPAQLVQDARRHDVEIRPVDVQASRWECTLEEDAPGSAPAVRLGFVLVKGMTQRDANTIETARERGGPFDSVEALVHRASLSRAVLERLARAGALAALSGHRHRAAWAAAGCQDALPLLRRPREGEEAVADYIATGLTLGRHPLSLLRERLERQGFRASGDIKASPHGQRVRTAGIVTCRQHPSSAHGTLFLTLEDELGMTNIIVWKRVAERYPHILMGASLLGVSGSVQRENTVCHVVAHHLEDHSSLLGRLKVSSRDFR